MLSNLLAVLGCLCALLGGYLVVSGTIPGTSAISFGAAAISLFVLAYIVKKLDAIDACVKRIDNKQK